MYEQLLLNLPTLHSNAEDEEPDVPESILTMMSGEPFTLMNGEYLELISA